MPAGRETDDAYFSRIYSPFRSTLAYQLYSPLCILQRAYGFIRHNLVAWQAIGQYKSGNTNFGKLFSYIGTFFYHRKVHITTTRANHYSGTVSFPFFGKVW